MDYITAFFDYFNELSIAIENFINAGTIYFYLSGIAIIIILISQIAQAMTHSEIKGALKEINRKIEEKERIQTNLNERPEKEEKEELHTIG